VTDNELAQIINWSRNLRVASEPEVSTHGVRKQNTAESDPTDLSEIAVLIAHSDPVISAGLVALLRESGKFKVLCYRRRQATSEPTRDPVHSAAVVIADYDSGIRLAVTAAEFNSRVVILTDSDSEAKICRAFARGVRGYLLLGCTLEDIVAGIRCVHEGGVAVAPRVASRIAESLNQETLTAREQSVLRQMTLGQSNKRIAQEFGLAVATVKVHVKSILRKLNAGNRGEAVAIARRRGILPDEIECQAPGCARSAAIDLLTTSKGREDTPQDDDTLRNAHVRAPPRFGVAGAIVPRQ
jgi:DNA-binding NarL/FixJ family response regulator